MRSVFVSQGCHMAVQIPGGLMQPDSWPAQSLAGPAPAASWRQARNEKDGRERFEFKCSLSIV